MKKYCFFNFLLFSALLLHGSECSDITIFNAENVDDPLRCIIQDLDFSSLLALRATCSRMKEKTENNLISFLADSCCQSHVDVFSHYKNNKYAIHKMKINDIANDSLLNGDLSKKIQEAYDKKLPHHVFSRAPLTIFNEFLGKNPDIVSEKKEFSINERIFSYIVYDNENSDTKVIFSYMDKQDFLDYFKDFYSHLKDNVNKKSFRIFLTQIIFRWQADNFLSSFIEMNVPFYNIQDNQSEPLLCYALRREKYDFVKTILSSNTTNLNLQSNLGYTSLYCAKKEEFIFDLLFQYGACPNIQNDEGFTPISYFFYVNPITCFLPGEEKVSTVSKIINSFFQHKANFNIQNAQGLTCLMIARHGPLKIMGLLLQLGAKPDINRTYA